MTPSQLVRNRREEILNIANQYGARNVRLFGSCARNEDSADSDVDVVVEMASGRDLLDLIAIEQDLSELLGCKVDVLTDGGISPYLEKKILTKAQPL